MQIKADEQFRIPHTVDGWRAHIRAGILPAYEYLDEKLQDRKRARALELCVAAEIFVPYFARTLTDDKAFEFIDRLRLFPKLDKNSMIDGLKTGWYAFKYHSLNERRPRKEVDVLQWHYDHQYLERSFVACKACRKPVAREQCRCQWGLQHYYRAVKLLVLLQPSSAGAERVFSVLKRYFDEQQETSLTDAIRVAIFLEVNNRPLV